MPEYVLLPEVAGHLGDDTVFIGRSSIPPVLAKMHYEFDGWMGDPIVATMGCFIVTGEVTAVFSSIGATGASFEDAKVTRSEEFRILHRGRRLPRFMWLQITGRVGQDDFSRTPDGDLIVTERVLDLFLGAGMKHARFVEVDKYCGRKNSTFRQRK